ncbi:MAG: putative bifunctional diguanylate cyclase/phosphodiesterase [Acidimicrobiia bacterium]
MTLAGLGWDVFVSCDSDWVIVAAEGDVASVCGRDVDALLGRRMRDLVHGEDALPTSSPGELRIEHADGSWRVVRAALVGDATAPTIALRDVTEVRVLAQQVVHLEHELNRIEGAEEASQRVFDAHQSALDVVARSEPLSSTLHAIVELVESVVAPLSVAVLAFDDDDDFPRVAVAQGLPDDWFRQSGIIEALRTDRNGWLELAGPDGPARWFRWSRLIHGEYGVLGAVMVLSRHQRFPSEEEQRVTDVAARLAQLVLERARTLDELAHRERHDPLTGLPNRLEFLDRLDGALARIGPRGMVAVMCVDIDHFQHVNDAFGHREGDAVLIEVARRLRGALRGQDVLARFGGDEFSVMCHVDGVAHARLVAERIERELDRPFTVGESVVRLSASIGIALPAFPASGSEALVRDADTALHRAKANGRSHAEVFDDALRADLLTRLDTQASLRDAIDRGELTLQFQPVVRLADDRVSGVEALLRWRRADGTVALPGEFIELAEETGLILAIGAWVLESAALQSAQWRADHPDDPPSVVAVNLSARQLAAPGFVDEVRLLLERTGADPAGMYLEITEHVLVQDFDGVVRVLEQLRELGLRVVMDDFGTGYSSLQYLKRLPLDMLKIDCSFVVEIDRSERDVSIARAIVDVAHAFGYGVVAEGVERPEQLAILRELGCEYAQGFYLGRPMDAVGIEAMWAGADSPDLRSDAS